MAACGSKWSGVALSTEAVPAVPSVRDAKKSEVLHNPTALHLRGSILRWCGSQWRSSVPNTIRKYVLLFLKLHFLKLF